MRAAVLREFGGPDVLLATDVPEPTPGAGEALIDVEFANITFIETQIRAGMFKGTPMTPDLPGILGTGVGGTVVAVGDDAASSLLGRQVVARTGGTGGYAERVAVSSENVIDVPAGLGLDEAVALMADGRTALTLMQASGPAEREIALVEAAGGGVGSILLQLCRNAGATVVAAARGEGKLELARDLGADLAIDYGDSGWADQVRKEIGGVDVAFDGVGGDIGRQTFELVRRGGRLHAFGGASGAMLDLPPDDVATRQVDLRIGTPLSPEEMLRLTKEILQLGAAGSVRPTIGQRFALSEAARAHAAIESRGTIGKTLLVAGDSATARATASA